MNVEQVVSDILDMTFEDKCNIMIKEWEAKGEGYTHDFLDSDELYLCKEAMVPIFRYKRWEETGHLEDYRGYGVTREGFYIDLDSEPLEVFLYDIEGGEYITQDGLKELGVEDILNLKPYEYGTPKLKYGLTEDTLFVPSFFKPLIKFWWEGDI